ncbi:fibronectin type III domain-containing protein [Candidatus Peribacteria bacterium]|nr:MAG: fibronectin type III domain-containing protein [Candidatus Peribacteria bacterium]
MNTHTTCRRRARTLLVAASVVLSMQTQAFAQSFEMLPPLGDGREYAAGPSTNNTANNGAMNGAATDAAAQGTMFELRPHCDSAEYRTAFAVAPKEGVAPVPDSSCASYEVKDPLTRQTSELREGDALDMDLIIKNPTSKPIQRFRAWIAYDPTVMEGELIEVANAFPTPTPGENDFSTTDGMIKVSGAATTPQNGQSIIVARIRLHMLPGTQTAVPMTFYDATGTVGSHTAIITMDGSTETNSATATPGSLLVKVLPSATGGTASSTPVAGSVSSSTESLASSSVSSAGDNASSAPSGSTSGVFEMLQVQQLKVTTEGSSVFLAWNKLPSADLVGYNVYYGTISGQYLQKRSVDKNSTNITIRALPEGVTYYFAVRGVSKDNRETDFSQEVGISVGNPATSTSPLSASAINRAPNTPRTGGNVSGETGPASTVMLFVLLSAVIGTGLAFRRQLSAKV